MMLAMKKLTVALLFDLALNYGATSLAHRTKSIVFSTLSDFVT